MREGYAFCTSREFSIHFATAFCSFPIWRSSCRIDATTGPPCFFVVKKVRMLMCIADTNRDSNW